MIIPYVHDHERRPRAPSSRESCASSVEGSRGSLDGYTECPRTRGAEAGSPPGTNKKRTVTRARACVRVCMCVLLRHCDYLRAMNTVPTSYGTRPRALAWPLAALGWRARVSRGGRSAPVPRRCGPAHVPLSGHLQLVIHRVPCAVSLAC